MNFHSYLFYDLLIEIDIRNKMSYGEYSRSGGSNGYSSGGGGGGGYSGYASVSTWTTGGFSLLTFLLGEMAIILTVVAMEEVVAVAATAAVMGVAIMVAAAMEEVEVEIVCQAWAKG